MSELSNYSVEELTEALNLAKHREEAERNKLRESVTPLMRITVRPVEDTFEKLYDTAARWYEVYGECVNVEELEAVGAKVPSKGGYKYLFNIATGKFIMGSGGGTIFLPTGPRSRFNPSQEVMDELASIVLSNPDKSQDITGWVNAHKARILSEEMV